MSNNLNAQQVRILKDVIAAARDGRYCHGNGAMWVYTEKGNPKQVICADHTTMKVTRMSPADSERYLNNSRPYRDENTAKSLEDFIK